MDKHLYQLQQWVAQRLASVVGAAVMDHETLLSCWQTVAGDASARRYYRVALPGHNAKAHSFIVMDSSADLEATSEFVSVADLMRDGGVRVPQIYSCDLALGFLLLEDFGDVMLKQLLKADAGQVLFDRLLPLLTRLVTCPTGQLATYDEEKLQQELALFDNWYLQAHLGVYMSADEQALWQTFCQRLVSSARQQPQVLVHRDFHSCNLHDLPDGDIGVIDFQDALAGPVTYDLVSWLWDRYIEWSRAELEAWMEQARLIYATQSTITASSEEWRRQCDWMGLQRNIKIVGIFARLHYRDNKDGYLSMIPQFANYINDVLARYAQFDALQPVMRRWLSAQ